MTQAVIRTVLRDIPPETLGRTDYHEHLLHVSPLLAGDELDDVELSRAETAELQATGFDALVDLTPLGLGRNPLALAGIARATGMTIVAATGVHQEVHYPGDHPVRAWSEGRMADYFVQEIAQGMAQHPFASGTPEQARAGVIKVGIGYWSISGFEERVLRAAAAAHRRTGAGVVCHLEHGTAAWEAASLLEQNGVSRTSIVLAHADRNPDPGLHAELAHSGVFLGYDGVARTKYWPDSILLQCLIDVARRGGGDQILLGGDVARRSSFRAYGGLPGMAYLGERFVPRLRAEGGEELLHTVLTENPARALQFVARS